MRSVDPAGWRRPIGPDQPDSLQGSTHMGHCALCRAGTVPLKLETTETASGPGGKRWLCVQFYRARNVDAGADSPWLEERR